MGFFSEIASEARRGMVTPICQTTTPPAAPKPAPAPPIAPEAPAARPVPTPPSPIEASTPPQAPPQPDPAPSAHTPKLAAEDTAQAPDDTAARQSHEAAEAKRKAEFDARQAERLAKRQATLDRIAAMNDAELLAASVERVATDTEKLTRRNMKEAVAEHIQAKCREDAAFARLVMDPEKSMVHCFQYINRQARKYAEQEMKDHGIERTGVYGLDVPDDLVYQWAEDYFNDPNAKEDDKNEGNFVPKPYVPAAHKKGQNKAAPKPSDSKKPRAEKPADTSMEQISLM